MKRKNLGFQIVIISLLAVCFAISIPAAFCVGGRTVINGKQLTSMENFLTFKGTLNANYFDYDYEIDTKNVVFNDSNNEIKNYLKSLTWEECDSNYGCPSTRVAFDVIYIGNETSSLKIFEFYEHCSITWQDGGFASATSYYKINLDAFGIIKNIILSGGSSDA